MSGNKTIKIMTAALVLILFLTAGAFSQADRIKTEPEKTVIFADQQDTEFDQASGKDAPKIYFPESEHDFGQVSQETKQEHVFKVQNTGKAPLKIIKAKGS